MTKEKLFYGFVFSLFLGISVDMCLNINSAVAHYKQQADMIAQLEQDTEEINQRLQSIIDTLNKETK